MKVLVAMSGGVDSTLAASILREEGHTVAGATLALYDTAVSAAVQAAKELGIEHFVIDAKDAFMQNVVRDFADEYTAGRTPNPCVRCNKTVKFPLMYDFARKNGFNAIATGHYAKIEYSPKYGRRVIMAADDKKKDQSYVLCSLSREIIEHTLFPLSHITKTKVRESAREKGMSSASLSDSQDICFIPDGDYAKFLESVMSVKSPCGAFVDAKGNVLGEHKGIIHYTVGQRKGLGLSFDAPRFVLAKNAPSNTITLGRYEEQFQDSFEVRDANWSAFDAPPEVLEASVKVRYAHSAASVTLLGGTHAHLAEALRALTPGQSAVFYDGDILLGGGIII